jgi:hypothetical protein
MEIKIRPLIKVLSKIIKLPKDSYLDPTTLGSGNPTSAKHLAGDSTWVESATGTVHEIDTEGLISGGPITDHGTITTSMNTGKLVGRSTAGVGIMEEITVGTGLILSGGTLYNSSIQGLYAQTALGTIITNTILEKSLIGAGVGTLSVPANGFAVGDSFTVKMCGNLSCANNETIRIRIKSDGVTIGDLGVFQMNTTTNKFFELIVDFTVTKIGGPGVAELFVNGQYGYNQDTAGLLRGNNFGLVSNTVFDTTVLNALSITAQWGAADTLNKIQSQNFVLSKTY